MMQQTISIEKYNQLVSRIETLTIRARGAESGLVTAQAQAGKLREALSYVVERCDAYAVDEPGECDDCDLLREIGGTAKTALSASPASSLAHYHELEAKVKQLREALERIKTVTTRTHPDPADAANACIDIASDALVAAPQPDTARDEYVKALEAEHEEAMKIEVAFFASDWEQKRAAVEASRKGGER